MMIGDDNVYLMFNCTRDSDCIRYSAINRDHYLDSLARQSIDGIHIHAKTFIMSVRNVDNEVLVVYTLEEIVEHCRSRYTIGIIVRVYGDLFIAFYGLND